MQSLLNTLKDYDRGQLRIIAEQCGIPVAELSQAEMAQDLANQLLDQALVLEILDGLDRETSQALLTIQSAGGQLSVSEMERRFGSIRRMGPGRRDREKPWREPISPHEHLWYVGLISHAFADSPQGPREYVFIPTDLLQLMPTPPPVSEPTPGEAVAAPPITQMAGAYAIDDATTILAALRRQPANQLPLPQKRTSALAAYLNHPKALSLLLTLLQESHLLSTPPVTANPDLTRGFLETDPAQNLAWLFVNWQDSLHWNDLAGVPGLGAGDGGWPNEPLQGRAAILRRLKEIPIGSWWSIESFIESIRIHEPDFQRPAGDFESWYLVNTYTDDIHRGIEGWDQVEGALIRYLITGPLHWLGGADLGFKSTDSSCTSFRLTPLATLFKHREGEFSLPEREAVCQLKPDGHIIVPRNASLLDRYQISRFAAWREYEDERYHFQLTPGSMEEALKSGFQTNHVRIILEQASKRSLPPVILKALENWIDHGISGAIERKFILKLDTPNLLATLKENRTTARYLKETLGSDSVVVGETEWDSLYRSALKLGLWLNLPKEAGGESP